MRIVSIMERGKEFYMEFIQKHPDKKEEATEALRYFLENLDITENLDVQLQEFKTECEQLI